MTRRILCILLTLIMVLGLVPGSAFAAEEPPKPITAKVLVSGQTEGAFLCPPQYLTVDSNLAESYKDAEGNALYTDAVDPKTAVSALDVLVAANEAMMGKETFAQNPADCLVVDAGGMIKTMFGVATTSTGYAVNGKAPHDDKPAQGGWYMGYMVNAAPIKDGDKVDFFFYSDPNWRDTYPVFADAAGKAVTSLQVVQGDTVSLQLKGYAAMAGAMETIEYAPLENVNLMLSDGTKIEGAVTDAQGNVTFKIPENMLPGQYYYSVCEDVEDEYVLPGVLPVTVKGQAAQVGSLIIHTQWNPGKGSVLIENENDKYEAPVKFNPATVEYNLPDMSDILTVLRFRATPAHAGDKVILHYGEDQTKDITCHNNRSSFADCLKTGKNTLKLEVVPAADSGRETVVYTINVNCVPSVKTLQIATDNGDLFWDTAFKNDQKEYNLTVSAAAKSLTIHAAAKSDKAKFTYNGQENATVDLTDLDKITVVCDADGVQNIFTLNIKRVPVKNVAIKVEPADAIVKVYDKNGNTVAPQEDGTYNGLFGAENYTYTVACTGYKGLVGQISGNEAILGIRLEKAPESNHQPVDAYWPSFRGNSNNIGITDAKTPIDPEKTVLKWNRKLGSGWGAAPSVQIIVDDGLITMSGQKLVKLDLQTGETLKEGKMAASPNWGYTPPLYANGMIFCPLTNGTIQAFDATTLESVWIYKDPMGGQSLSPIAYSDGYIYVGFWNQETKAANFVCLSVTDEDPSVPNEAKMAAWKHTQMGGFYWAGAVTVGEAVIVGTDDGAREGAYGESWIYAFNKKTGDVISKLELKGAGDQRSTMAYDQANGKIYFTTKSGFLGRVSVDAVSGAISDLKLVRNQTEGECTSTPVVYKGRVYYGTGMGFGNPSKMIVADSETLEVLYTLDIQAYPQCSVMLSTAYEEETGFIYLYTTYNGMPGGITMMKVDPNATTAEKAEVIEIYDAKGFEQYCICSVICGPDGTLYYKNDSANLLAIGIDSVESTIAKIQKLETAGEITLKHENMVLAARTAYDSLSTENQAKIDAAMLKILTDAEAKILEIQKNQAQPVSDMIAALQPESFEKLDDAYYRVLKAYYALTPGTRKQVVDGDKLEAPANKIIKDLEDKYAAIKKVTLKSEADIYALLNAYDALNPVIEKVVPDYWQLGAQAMRDYRSLRANTIKDCTNKINAIGEVTQESRDAITAAREVYDSLLDAYGTDINEEIGNTEVLIAAEAKLAELDQAEAAAVDAQIAALGDVTLESEEAILAAREAYEALHADVKALVKNADVLTAAEQKLLALKDAELKAQDQAAADAVDAQIAALGKITAKSKDAVAAARAAFDALTDAQKDLVKNKVMLTSAETLLNRIENADVLKDLADSKDLTGAVLTMEEKALAENGAAVHLYLIQNNITDSVSAADKSLIENAADKAKVGLYLNIELLKQVGNNVVSNITKLDNDLSVTISVPAELINTDASVRRTYSVIRLYNGQADILSGDFDAIESAFTFSTDRFCTYALAYTDTPVSVVPETGDHFNIAVPAVLLGVSVLALALVVVAYKKKSF